jgi:hypothetical protein
MKKAVLREDLMALTKDVTQALVLGQMLYWTKTLDQVNDWLFEENKRLAEVELPQHEYNYGWIYKSAREMREDLMDAFSEDAIQRAFSSLVTKGVLMKRNNPFVRYDRKLQYRIDMVYLRRLLKDRGYEMTDFLLGTIPQEAEFIPQGAECIPHGAETITEINTKIKNKELKPLPLFQGEPKPKRKPKLVDDAFINELIRLNPDKDIEREVQKAKTWILAKPNRQFTQQFLSGWINRSKPQQHRFADF